MLTYPTPRRMAVETPKGKWYSAKWTAEGIRQLQSAGGWFYKGGHDFADLAAAKQAGVRSDE